MITFKVKLCTKVYSRILDFLGVTLSKKLMNIMLTRKELILNRNNNQRLIRAPFSNSKNTHLMSLHFF